MRVCLFVAAIHLFAVAAPAFAQDQDPAFQLSAFGTLGLAGTDTHKVEFRRDNLQPAGAIDKPLGSVDTRLGVQLSSRLSDDFLATLQVVSKYRFDGTYRPDVMWACVTWSPTQNFSAKFGRLGIEMLPNWDFTNVGYTYPWVRPPVEAFFTITPAHIDGAELNQTLDLGPEASVTFKAFGGTASEKIPGILTPPLDLSGGPTYGFAVKPRWGGFRGRLTYSHFEIPRNFGGPVVATQNYLHAVAAQLHDPRLDAAADALNAKGVTGSTWSLGGSYEEGPLQVQGMVRRGTYSSFIFPDPTAGFFSLAYRFGRFQPFLTWSRIYSPRKAPPDLGLLPTLPGPVPAFMVGQMAQAANNLRADQFTWAGGVRWDFADTACLKFQVDRVHSNQSTGLWKVDDPTWNGKATVMSVTLDFILGGVR